MPIVSPSDEPRYSGDHQPYYTLCGLTHDQSGERYNFVTGDRHERKCEACSEIQARINLSIDNLVEINQLGHVIKVSQVIKKIKEQFGLSSTRARQEVAHARARKLKQWGGV